MQLESKRSNEEEKKETKPSINGVTERKLGGRMAVENKVQSLFVLSHRANEQISHGAWQ